MTFGGTTLAQEPTPTPPPSSISRPPAADAVPVSGSLDNGGERLTDVDVLARDPTGDEVARTTSKKGGRWTLELSPGSYTFEVDSEI